jgi:hypothetical protein
VAQIRGFGRVVNASEYREPFHALTSSGFHFEQLSWHEAIRYPVERKLLFSSESECLTILAGQVLQGQNPHAYQVRAVDAFVTFCDDGFDPEPHGSLGGGVTRRSSPILFASQCDQRNTLSSVALCSLKDGHQVPAGLMRCPGILFSVSQSIAQADIGPGAACNHFVVASACAVGIEILSLDSMFGQITPSRTLESNIASWCHMIGRDGIPEGNQDTCPYDILQWLWFGREICKKRRFPIIKIRMLRDSVAASIMKKEVLCQALLRARDVGTT